MGTNLKVDGVVQKIGIWLTASDSFEFCKFLQCIAWIATIGGKKFITALSSLGENSNLYPHSMAPTPGLNPLEAVK